MSSQPRMSWTVEDAGRYVRIRTSGTFDIGDHATMVRDIVSRPFWRPGRDTYFDHRALEWDGTGYVAMTVAASTHRTFDDRIGAGRAAILVGGAADYGIGRIFGALTEGGVLARIRVFTDADDAEAWLDQEPDASLPDA